MEVAKLLIASGSNVNERDYYLVPGIYSRGMIVPILRETALHKAVKNRNIEGVELLISKGADINAKDGARNQITPLHLAVQNRDKLMVELLVAKGADVRARDTTGNTPLRIAETNGYTEIVELLRRGATK
jgi:ankyrin repeat protein